MIYYDRPNYIITLYDSCALGLNNTYLHVSSYGSMLVDINLYFIYNKYVPYFLLNKIHKHMFYKGTYLHN